MKHLLNNMSEEEKNAIREQHTGGMKLNTEKFFRLLESKLGDAKPLTEQATAQTGTTATQKTKEFGEYSGDLVGKTANFYFDKENTNFVMTGTIKNIEKTSIGVDIKAEFKIAGGKEVGDFLFDWHLKEFRFRRGDAPQGYYSNNLANELTKRFCDVSSGGREVPAADYLKP